MEKQLLKFLYLLHFHKFMELTLVFSKPFGAHSNFTGSHTRPENRQEVRYQLEWSVYSS